MSKQSFRKFKKHDYSEDEYYEKNDRHKIDKRKARRIKRAIQTRDIYGFSEDEDSEDYFYADDFKDNF